ncbi:hypothetical protein QGN32_07675 [Mycolicibacterium sp. ND9-15]|uniref:hypothetical protein n=1 Tax=Mycolicibacterium sp. ND9-15 TaxID=3042320 RepID=UPI002DDBCD9E|nr:hypothetical protein [Mycolicibacterium sp. ND9-15]WSE57736.1 hypothetical protein QGN32_07675 [Mycolicibacterium sp. ND9-15]
MTDTPSQVHFRRDAAGSPWRWHTTAGRASSRQTEVRRLDKALREFFRQHGYADWVPDEGMFGMPPGYALHKVSGEHYVVSSDKAQ